MSKAEQFHPVAAGGRVIVPLLDGFLPTITVKAAVPVATTDDAVPKLAEIGGAPEGCGEF